MIVWRVENTEGEGPYVGYDLFPFDAFERKSIDPRWPGPLNDGISKPPGGFDFEDVFFGFSSKTSLWQWFGSFRDRLEQNGFFPWRFKCPDALVVTGRKQVGFIRGRSKRLNKLEWETLAADHENVIGTMGRATISSLPQSTFNWS